MSMLFNFRPLVINPQLAIRIGLNEAIVLQQVNYWINEKEQGVNHGGRRWVFNSYESWVKQFPFWSADTVKRAFTSLVKQGCLDVEQLNKSRHDRTNFYTINHSCEMLNDAEHLPSSSGASCPHRDEQVATIDKGKNACSLMVTTTKTTTENNSIGTSAKAGEPSRNAKDDYSPEFELAWQAYPKRSGGNPKNSAYKAWNARLREGVKPESMLEGVKRYATFVQTTGNVGTQYVKQASTFFGPDRHFEESWLAPSALGGARGTSQHTGFGDRDYGTTSAPVWARG